MPLTSRRHLLLTLLIAGLHSAGLAQSFPDRPIKLIVPFGAGSAVDTIARAMAAQASEQIGQPIQIDNRTGANGIIAAEAVARAAPDGYTLLMPNDGIMAANPALYAKLPYDPVKDFSAITLTSTVPLVLVAHPSFAASNVQELIAGVKAKPGAKSPDPVIEMWIDKATENNLKQQDFALSGRLMRTSYYPKWDKVFSETKKAEVYYPKEIRIFDEVEKENRTTILIDTVDLRPLEPNVFTKAWLEAKSR
jgi:hypothetical protein